MKQKHFHLAAATTLAITSIYFGVIGIYEASMFLVVGAFVAFIHYKASKSGVTD